MIPNAPAVFAKMVFAAIKRVLSRARNATSQPRRDLVYLYLAERMFARLPANYVTVPRNALVVSSYRPRLPPVLLPGTPDQPPDRA
jgi:hypothetical protein